MAYDSSISSDVSLSRILDELIAEGTDIDIIVQFLKSHESVIGDIYRHSSMVYCLYDVAQNATIHPFLLDHIGRLNRCDMVYATSSILAESICDGTSHAIKSIIRYSIISRRSEFPAPSRTAFRGLPSDDDVYNGNVGIVEYLNEIPDYSSISNLSHFMTNSYLVRSAFNAGIFLMLNPMAQYGILTYVVDSARKSYNDGEWAGRNRSFITRFHSEMLVSLLKQLLYLNEIDMFNWVVNVICRERGTKTISYRGDGFYIFENLASLIPHSILDMIDDNCGIEEIVFEMNLLETQFDTTDLFLLVYLFKSSMRRVLVDNPDLIDFFNLPVKWHELAYLKEGCLTK